MDPRQIELFFHEGLAIAPEERAEWLRGRCGDDRMLLAEISSLLEANAAMAAADAPSPAEAAVSEPPPLPGGHFGVWKPVRPLGRGGMSSVYLAKRADGQFEQFAALKVMAGYLTDPEFLRRFETERQLLASLNHNNITHLLDGGVSSDGDPFLVTEYVDGQNIDAYCDERKLSVEARLRIFQQVCEAVEYAHRNLIVHRDLKPGNILVNGAGAVKLLDFGTASLASRIDLTVTRMRMLTPRYASPEQLRGERVNIASDVFSLGIVLFELLTGAWPFGNSNSVMLELRRAAGEASPIAPEIAVTQKACELRSVRAERLRSLLAGDLSAITLKALENDPSKRYATVAALADDLARFLDGRPVEARSPTYIYRAGKFLRRRWLAVAAASIFVIGLSTSAALAVRQARVARGEAARALDESDKSGRVTDFLRGMLQSATNYGGPDVTVVQMLNAAEPSIERSSRDHPLTEATLRASLGASYVTLAQPERARQQLERAVTLFHSLNRPADEGDALFVLGINAQGAAGTSKASVDYYRRSIDALVRAGKDASPQLLVRARVYLAGVLFSGDYKISEAHDLIEQALKSERDGTKLPIDLLGAALAYRGLILVESGRFEEAETALQRTVETYEKATDAWVGLARSRFLQGDYSGAARFAQRNYEVASQIGVVDQAEAALEWARYRSSAGEAAPALAQMAEALPTLAKEYPAGSRHGYMLEAAAYVLNRAGRYAEAEQQSRAALNAIRLGQIPERHPLTAAIWADLGVALHGLRRDSEAAPALEQAENLYGQLGSAYTGRAAWLRRLD